MAKNSEIKFDIQLDENQVPEKINWKAEGSEKLTKIQARQ